MMSFRWLPRNGLFLSNLVRYAIHGRGTLCKIQNYIILSYLERYTRHVQIELKNEKLFSKKILKVYSILQNFISAFFSSIEFFK